MAKLIDVENAWKVAQSVFSDPALLHAIRVVLDKSTTVDAAEVVRCEDCKRSDHSRCGVDGVLYCMKHSRFMVYDNFCSYGERRD